MPAHMKYDPDTMLPKIKDLALAGKTYDEIAAELGIYRSTLSTWRARYPDLKDALNVWREEADDRVEDSLYRMALTGNSTAAIFWLKNRKPKDWRDKTVTEQEGTVHTKVEVVTGIPPAGDDLT
jgi:hypothetical protein